MALMEVRGLVTGYGRADILRGVSLYVEAGEVVAVIGPNGAGKSTLLKTIFGLVRPRGGTMRYRGDEIGGSRPHELVRRGLGFVPQEKNVFASLTVEENLRMGHFAGSGPPGERLEAVFGIFPFLREARGSRAGNLSGGEQQMTAIGRALMLSPELLLLDEPSAGLAPLLVAEIFSQVKRVNEAGVAVVMVEQNVKKALEIADRGYVLAMGRNVIDDTGANLLESGEMGQLYLGR